MQSIALRNAWALVIVAGIGTMLPASSDSWIRYEAMEQHMGTEFKVVLYAPNQASANRATRAAFDRIHQLDEILSDYNSASELGRLSNTAPHCDPVPVGDDLWRVLSHSRCLSHRTQGSFDVTIGPLTKLWRRARRRKVLPSAEQLAGARAAVGFQHMHLDRTRHTVRLLRPGMRLDLGGIGKGYALDQALLDVLRMGFSRVLIDGGGDMAVGDAPPGRIGWPIAIAGVNPDAPPSGYLQLANCGVATSGDAWQFVEIDGRRYSHILDPRTGMGLTVRRSVTVVARHGITADSLASAVSVMGPQAGIALVQQTPGAAALIVQIDEDGVHRYASRGFYQRTPAKKPCSALEGG